MEFDENSTFDKKCSDVIKNMIQAIKSTLGQTDLEKCTDAWLKFISIKQDSTESTKAYVTRFEQAESLLRNVNIIVPDKALAIHLLSKSSLQPQSKENVITKTNLDSNEHIYTSMKKSLREMKSNLTTSEEKSDLTVPSTSKNETFYSGHRSRKSSHHNHSSRRESSKS